MVSSMQVDVGAPQLIGGLVVQRLSAYAEADRHFVSKLYLTLSLNGWEWQNELKSEEIKVVNFVK